MRAGDEGGWRGEGKEGVVLVMPVVLMGERGNQGTGGRQGESDR